MNVAHTFVHPQKTLATKIDAYLRGVLTHTQRIDTSATMSPCVTETHLLTRRRRRQSANASRRFPTAFLKGCQKTVLGVLSVGCSAFGLTRVQDTAGAPVVTRNTTDSNWMFALDHHRSNWTLACLRCFKPIIPSRERTNATCAERI